MADVITTVADGITTICHCGNNISHIHVTFHLSQLLSQKMWVSLSTIAIYEIHPKVLVRFTLKNVRNNPRKGWTQTIEDKTLEDLSDSVYAAAELQKIDVW